MTDQAPSAGSHVGMLQRAAGGSLVCKWGDAMQLSTCCLWPSLQSRMVGKQAEAPAPGWLVHSHAEGSLPACPPARLQFKWNEPEETGGRPLEYTLEVRLPGWPPCGSQQGQRVLPPLHRLLTCIPCMAPADVPRARGLGRARALG